MTPNDHTENQIFHALKELQIAKLLRKSNITKSCGVSAYEVFQFLLLLVFRKVTEWIASQITFIQALCGNICWES